MFENAIANALPSGIGFSRRPASWALALSALALSACASLPSLPPERQAEQTMARATERSFAAARADWPADAWWRRYNDPQLDALIDEALAGSPNLARAWARVRKSEALAGEARAAAAPQLSADASVQESKLSYHNGIPPAFTPKGYNDTARTALDFNWEIDFWGRNRAAVAAAVSETRAARAEAAQARLILATNVAAAYAELGRLYAQRDIAERMLAAKQRMLDLARRRTQSGLDSEQPLDQAQAGPRVAQGDLDALDEEIAQTRHRLAALLGAGPDRGLTIARPTASGLKAFGLPDHVAADLIGRRPDLVAARWRAEAAEKRIGEAKAAFYPNINLVAFAGAQALHVHQLTIAGSDIGGVGPALSLPILDGGRLRSNLRGERADRDAAVAAYDEALTEALRDVADVIASERALATQAPQARAALRDQENAWRIARLRYEGGMSDYEAVLAAEQAALSQARVVADLDNRALVLDVALVRALGGGFTSP